MMYFDRRHKIAVWAVSLSVFAALMTAIFLQGTLRLQSPYMIPIDQRLNNSIVMGILVIFTFPAIIETINSKWLRGVDDNTPRLLLDVTEAVRSGVPLINALEEASEREYGPINKPLNQAMAKFRLTSDLEDALEGLGESLIRPVVRRMSTILLEAYETGGRIIDVLDTSVDLFTNLAEYREERLSQMRPYVFIVYLGSAIFLAISWVILVKFLAPIHAAVMDPSISTAGIIWNLLDINYYKSVFFWAAVIESIFGGLVAGKIGTGRTSSGMVHTVMLLAMTIIFFNTFRI